MATQHVGLPGFAGLSFFTAVVQQQRRAEGHLLPVPVQQQPVNVPDEEPNAHASGGQWVQQSVQLALDLGFAPAQQVGDVAAVAPRSKAERSFSKRSWAALGQQVQPSVKQWHTAPQGIDQQAAAAVADGSPASSARTVAEVAASQVASFSKYTDASWGSSSGTISCGLAAGLLLDVPVFPDSGTCWGDDARWQVGCG